MVQRSSDSFGKWGIIKCVHSKIKMEERPCSSSDGTALSLSVKPVRGMVDEKFQVVLKNLPPRMPVTLHSLHHSEEKDFWDAFGHYVSNDQGTVTVAEDESVGGTYTGSGPMGLLWSMRPVPGSRTGIRLRKMNVLTPMVVIISAYRGHVSEGFQEQRPLASVVTERWYMAPGVQRINIMENGVRGTLFLPPGPGPFPGVLDMWGVGGGLVEYRSALLASHGFVSLAVDHHTADKISTTQLQYKYYEKAFKIIQDHPLVVSDRVGLFGLSFGALIALSMAAYLTTINPCCCVCVSACHARLGLRFSDVLAEIRKKAHKMWIDENNCVIWRDIILPIPIDPELKVEVGRIKCPLMLVVGEDDQNLPIGDCAEDIARMMRLAGNDHLLTTLSYPGAGHLIEPPYTPHFRSSKFLLPNTQEKVVLLWGGRTKPHADAQEGSWEKILAFLRQQCRSTEESVPPAKL